MFKLRVKLFGLVTFRRRFNNRPFCVWLSDFQTVGRFDDNSFCQMSDDPRNPSLRIGQLLAVRIDSCHCGVASLKDWFGNGARRIILLSFIEVEFGIAGTAATLQNIFWLIRETLFSKCFQFFDMLWLMWIIMQDAQDCLNDSACIPV